MKSSVLELHVFLWETVLDLNGKKAVAVPTVVGATMVNCFTETTKPGHLKMDVKHVLVK